MACNKVGQVKAVQSEGMGMISGYFLLQIVPFWGGIIGNSKISLMTSALMSLHVTSHTEGLPATVMGAFEWLFTGMAVAVYP